MTRIQQLLAENLRRERKRAGYSQEKLAELVELSPKYISSLEGGGRFPSPDTIQRIVDCLGLEPYELLIDHSYLLDRNADARVLAKFEEFLGTQLARCIRDSVRSFLTDSDNG